jgi:methionyl-tRNA synthetase
MPKRYYVTTPIYYVNDVPHIGTTLTTFAADVNARYQRMLGREVAFLTGTDENGLKIMEAAAKAGRTPQEHVDEVSQRFRDIWDGMNIRYDDFLRTTEPRHVRAVQRFFQVLRDKGHVYLDRYEGWYDVSTETFLLEADLVDGKSPDGNEVRWVSEENWFFRLSAFEEPLLAHIEANPRFILPEARRKEVASFIRQGLRDACISRANPGWGIPVPGDPGKVVYVWFDALINYVSAAGWPDEGWERLWPADVEWMGKDILTRFHATLWPAMLLGAGLPLPKTLVGHAWMLIGGDKMSKSRGNIVAPLDLAADLSRRSGCAPALAVDAVRHYMAATMPSLADSTYTQDELDKRYNADLANDLGNALNRSLSMVHRFGGGLVAEGEAEAEARAAIDAARSRYALAMEEFRIELASQAAFDLVRFLNKYIDSRAPWALAKAQDPALGAVLRSMLLCLRTIEGLLRPILPAVAGEVARQLGLDPLDRWEQVGAESSLPVGGRAGEPLPMFPRLDLRPEAASPSAAPGQAKAQGPGPSPPAEIEIGDFAKVELRIARVLEAEAVPGSDKLIKLQIMIGSQRRQIVAGIAKSYPPADLAGRQVVVVANLKPATLMGLESQGMVLAADGPDGSAILLQPEHECPEGASVH